MSLFLAGKLLLLISSHTEPRQNLTDRAFGLLYLNAAVILKAIRILLWTILSRA